MCGMNLMQQALGEQWVELPAVLQVHHQGLANQDVGALDIEYPRVMQICLNLLRLVGALVNRQGKAIATTVEKHTVGAIQYWQRTLRFADGQTILFKSRWEYAGGNRLIEYVNPVLGLCMAVYVRDGRLCYEGVHYVVCLGKLRLSLPEFLILGHTTIVESELDTDHFVMDFRLHHPLFGKVYRYAGRFRTE